MPLNIFADRVYNNDDEYIGLCINKRLVENAQIRYNICRLDDERNVVKKNSEKYKNKECSYYLSARGFLKEIGYDIEWDPLNKSISFQMRNNLITITAEESIIHIKNPLGEKDIETGKKAFIKDGNFLVCVEMIDYFVPCANDITGSGIGLRYDLLRAEEINEYTEDSYIIVEYVEAPYSRYFNLAEYPSNIIKDDLNEADVRGDYFRDYHGSYYNRIPDTYKLILVDYTNNGMPLYIEEPYYTWLKTGNYPWLEDGRIPESEISEVFVLLDNGDYIEFTYLPEIIPY